ncbi:hypothetical protein TWF481_009503 [Arthrobotrys musiformis]|uniref:F-box domain-containing protein n=1 Tax=Arthrobotrys musiformis TaxID=47236 RepID=A0AAV9W3Z5_9PEZI
MPTFLSLPPEIRLQIYSHLLIFPQRGQPYSLRLRKPSLDLSILRTNRQIHNEAIPILYSHNTFPINFHLLISCHEAVRTDIRRWLRVDYECFWECAGYIYRDGEKRGWEWHTDDPPNPPFTRLTQEPQPPPPPPLRHRNLIRNISLQIDDYRLELDYPEYMSPHTQHFRKCTKSAIIPALHRLQSIFPRKGIKASIVMSPNVFHTKEGSFAPLRGQDFSMEDLTRMGRYAFKEAVYVIWPLTMEWMTSVTLGTIPIYPLVEEQREIHTPGTETHREICKRFDEIKKMALEECNADEPFTAEEMEGFRMVKLHEEDETSWALKGSQLVLVNKWSGDGVVEVVERPADSGSDW